MSLRSGNSVLGRLRFRLSFRESAGNRRRIETCKQRKLLCRKWRLRFFDGDFADDAAGVSGGKDSVGNVARDNTSSADDGFVSDTNTGEDERSSAYPNVGTDIYGFAVLLLAPQFGFQRVHGREYLHAGSEQRVIANSDTANVQDDAVEVEEDTLTKFNVPAVVAVKGRLHPDGVAAFGKDLFQ